MHDPLILYWHLLQTVFVYTPRLFAFLLKQFNEDIEHLWHTVTLNDFLKVKASPEQWDAFCARKKELPITTIPDSLQIYTWHHPRYPPLLKEIADPPMVLYIQGTMPEGKPACAIVGARRPTPYGRHAARTFATSLGMAGLTIVSGLAYGIDTEAHQAALDAHAHTIAVLGSSIEMVYPQSNIQLARTIVQHGALISEYPPGTPPLAHHFPQRNRIIAGLAQCVLVVEATIDSGSRITARYAIESNRDVFAIPGDIGRDTSVGCNELIRTANAQLVTTPDQIMETLGIASNTQENPMPAANDLPSRIIALLKKTPHSIANLAQLLDVPIVTLQETLSYLEIEGRIQQRDPGYFSLH